MNSYVSRCSDFSAACHFDFAQGVVMISARLIPETEVGHIALTWIDLIIRGDAIAASIVVVRGGGVGLPLEVSGHIVAIVPSPDVLFCDVVQP